MFENMNDLESTVSKPLPEITDSEPADVEREAQLEEIETERASLLDKFLTSRITDSVANFIPGINNIKFAIEAAMGETISKRKLTGLERVIKGVESAALLIAYSAIAKEYLGSGNGEFTEVAVLGKSLALAGEMYLHKSFVLEKLAYFAENYAETTALLSALGNAISNVPDNMFSNKIIELKLNS